MIKKPVIILMLLMVQLYAKAQQTYQLDVKKSKILWNNGNTMGGHYGYLFFNSGSLNYSSAGEPVDGVFSMDMNSVRSTDQSTPAGNQKVGNEIKKPGFFDIDKYPEAKMNVKKIVPGDNSTTFKVSGDLTIKGVTNPIEFIAAIKQKGNTINVMAELKIHRLKWHIDMQPQHKLWDFMAAVKDKMIADEIAITLNLVLNKQ